MSLAQLVSVYSLPGYVLSGAEYVFLQLLHTAVLFALLYPLMRFARGRWPALVMCLCWLVILRLLVPVDLVYPFNLYNFYALFGYSPYDPLRVFTDMGHGIFPALSPLQAAPEAVVSPAALLITGVAVLWVCVSGFVIYRWCVKRRYLVLQAQAARPVTDGSLLRLTEKWRALLNIKRRVNLVSSPDTDFAFTLGFIHPYIMIPERVLAGASVEDLEGLVAHEMAHIKRLDDVTLCFLMPLRGLLFFYPPLRICLSYMSICREKLCDRTVLSQRQLTAAQYASGLVNVVRQVPGHVTGTVACLGSAALLTERIRYLRQGNAVRQITPIKSWALLSLMALVVFPLMSQSRMSIPPIALWASPVTEGYLSSVFGLRPMPIGPTKGQANFHRGIDIAAATGTAVYAVADGVVLAAVDDFANSTAPAYGRYLVIQHGDGMQSRYMHLDSLQVAVGQRVSAGQHVAAIGSTGQATGPHLHLELMRGDEHINPEEVLVLALSGH